MKYTNDHIKGAKKMYNGFIKVGAASIKTAVADTFANSLTIMETVRKAKEQKINILLFPELCITGCSCGDLFFSETLLHHALVGLQEITQETYGSDMITVVGLPYRYGGKLFDCAAIIQNGSIIGMTPKKEISAAQSRYFSADAENSSDEHYDLELYPYPFAKEIVFKHELFENYSFTVSMNDDILSALMSPVASAVRSAEIVLCPAASAATAGSYNARIAAINAVSSGLCCGYVYACADSSESTQDTVFSGHHIISECGELLAQREPFSDISIITTEIDIDQIAYERRRKGFKHSAEGVTTVIFEQEINDTVLTRKYNQNPFVPEDKAMLAQHAEEILNIQAYGLKKRLEHTNAKSAVIGISGGLDSTLALLVAIRAMKLCGREPSDIIAVTMPCFGTSERTKSNAVKLCELLGVTLKTVDISAAVKQHFADIGQSETSFDVTYENSQARERTQVLMDMANMYGGMVIGTGDLSELALGWATYTGDHMSMYGVKASVPKTLIRHIVAYEAAKLGGELESVLYDIVDTPVSPELLPADANGDIAQKTEDLVGPYELHDFFLYHAVRLGQSPIKIYRIAKHCFDGIYDSKTIVKWLTVFTRRFFNQQFKRSCLPDGPKTGEVSLSPRGEWMMPSDACSTLWLSELDGLE